MNNLPPDLRRSVLSYLIDEDITNLSQVSRSLSQIRGDDTFWLNKIIEKYGQYGFTKELIDKVKRNYSYRDYYNNLLAWERDDDILTPTVLLHKAVEKGRLDIALIALKQGASIDVAYGSSLDLYAVPLAKAIKNNDREMVDLLLEYNADINSRYPILLAIKDNNAEMVKYLLDRGAKVVSAMLSYTSSPEVIKLLLAAGADPTNDPELLKSAAKSSKNAEVVRLLLENGASAEGLQLYGGYDYTDEVFELLVKAGASAWLSATVQQGSPRKTLALLESGFNPNGEKNDGQLLISAVANNRTEIVKLLILYGADPQHLYRYFDRYSRNPPPKSSSPTKIKGVTVTVGSAIANLDNNPYYKAYLNGKLRDYFDSIFDM